MPTKNRNISHLIENQLPGFIADQYEDFSIFIEKYYQQLELTGQPLDIISNITKYRDINYYEKNLLQQKTQLDGNVLSSDTTITVDDATSFPERGGYIRINDEICFYKERTDTEFLEVSRGVSGNNSLGDLYNSSEFVTTLAANHNDNADVYNISNLFLYAFVRSFENQYLASFPEKYLKDDVDKRILIKNITDFYRAKGTEKSIQFLFNTIVAKDPNDVPTVLAPRDFTLKASTSDWITKYVLKVKVLLGDPEKLIGNFITQESEGKFASAVVDDVSKSGVDGFYEIVLNPSSINGTFNVASRTQLRNTIDGTDVEGDRIDVFSTQGWNGNSVLIDNEIINFTDKNVNQFVIGSRSNPNAIHSAGTDVYSADYISDVYDGQEVRFLTLGVLYNLNPQVAAPYSENGDLIDIEDGGVVSNHPAGESGRWFLNTDFRKAFSLLNPAASAVIGDLNADVSAVYEDDQYFYICSSGYPYHSILEVGSSTDLQDNKNLKLIRKFPTGIIEIYPTSNNDVGILADGSLLYSYKDKDEVIYGNIEKYNVISKGNGYKVPPFVLVNNQPYKARAFLNGETVSSIETIETEVYTSNPSITITSGRGAQLKGIVTAGEITSIEVLDTGEYYSSAPTIQIIDLSGKGNFAEYRANVNALGELVSCTKINGGRLYSRENLLITVIPEGSGAAASASVRKWVKDRYNVNFADLDDNYGTVINNGYGVIANPRQLRLRLSDNINSGLQENPGTKVHSPIIGFAYDGFPIYGPYGYSDPGDAGSVVSRIGSSYQLKGARPDGPSTTTYPLGTFIDDYEWIPSINTGKTLLDANNGRFCVTPEYPEGVYAYFITIDAIGTPVFPYSVGLNFYGLPVESNYTTSISQDDLPSNVKRLYQSDFFKNGKNSVVKINEVRSGFVNSAVVKGDLENFSPQNPIVVDNTGTSGSLLDAVVGEVNGKEVIDLESEQAKAVILSTKESAYFFENSTVFQGTGGVLSQVLTGTVIINEPTNSDSPDVRVAGDLQVNPAIDYTVIQTLETDLVQGVVIGDVEDDNRVVLRAVSGTFSKDLPISATIEAVSLTLDASASYTQGAILTYREKTTKEVLATGEVLTETNLQNSVRVKVLTGEFFISGDYEIKSSVFGDTSSRDIVTIGQLSAGLTVTDINDSVAILRTDEDHQVLPGDFVTVDVRPDDAVTETNYQVRKRKFQKIVLQDQTYDDFIDDSGIGRGEILTTGSDYETGEYTDVEIIFQDQTKTRENIGALGDINNAKATITVSQGGGGYGGIVDVVITDKGENYKIGDVLTIDPSAIDRAPGSTATQLFSFVVVHAGFGFQNTVLRVRNTVNNICEGDYIQIGEEILLVNDSDVPNNILFVTRGQKGTRAIDHYDGQPISLESYEYRFALDTRVFEANLNSPKIISYDQETREMLIGWLYDYPNEPEIVISSILSDRSNPSKYIDVESVEDPKFVLEFIDSEGNFFVNPVIDIQKLYLYTFDTSHPSMADTFLDFSPSINLNLFTAEKVVNPILPGTPGASVSLKIGFGPAVADNDLSTVIDPRFGNYYYFIQAGDDVDTSESFLRIIEDPLVGRKQVIFTTPEEIVYNVDDTPQYDGSGTITYTTSAKNAIGSIAKVDIINTGKNYKKIPLASGVLPTKSYRAKVTPSINANGEIIAIDIEEGGSFVNPVAIISDETGSGAVLECVLVNNSLSFVRILNGGSGYTDPTIEIYEYDTKIYFGSNNIGLPSSVTVESTGRFYSSDKTTLPQFKSNTTVVIDFDTNPRFMNGETVSQGSVTARVEEYRAGTNLLKLSNVTGPIESGQALVGSFSTVTVVSSFVSIFDSVINSYFDNIGFLNSEKGTLSSESNRLADNFYYQDYSYSIRSRTPINVWRDLILDTLHPAGFKLFGEVLIDGGGSAEMPEEAPVSQSITSFSLKATIEPSHTTTTRLTQSVFRCTDTNIRPGLGQIFVDPNGGLETITFDVTLQEDFDGVLDLGSNRVGTDTFTLRSQGSVYAPPSEETLIVTLDGIIQEPQESYVISGNSIIFSEPPFGERVAEGQEVPAQKFYCRSLKFKDPALTQQYFRKFEDISDNFDGVTTEFDLFEIGGGIVKTEPKENLFVVLDGVVQISGRSYTITRSTDPGITDKIVFSEPPINHGERYEGVDEGDNESKSSCYITSIGQYLVVTTDSYLVDISQKGPYPLYLDGDQKIPFVAYNPSNALVFVDGVLQVPDASYEILGNQITFTENLSNYKGVGGRESVNPSIDIIYFIGSAFESELTLFNYEPSGFYAPVKFLLDGTYDNLTELADFINGNSASEFIVYQNGNAILKVDDGGFQADGTFVAFNGLTSAYQDVDGSDIVLIGRDPLTIGPDEVQFTLTGTYTSSLLHYSDSNDFRFLKGYGDGSDISARSITARYFERRRHINDLLPGDEILIDGEDEYRKVIDVDTTPQVTQYNSGNPFLASFYGTTALSNYNKYSRGTPIAIDVEIDIDGKITSLNWNRFDIAQLNATGLTGTGASGYQDGPPIIQFVPATPAGGGAEARAIVDGKGFVIDIELVNPGFGYEVPPKVFATRRYRVKREHNRTLSHSSQLNLEVTKVGSILQSTTEIVLIPGPGAQASIFSIFSLGDQLASDLQGLTLFQEVVTDPVTIAEDKVEILRFLPTFNPNIDSVTSVQNQVTLSVGFEGIRGIVTVQDTDAEINLQIQSATRTPVINATSGSTRGTFLDAPFSETDTVLYVFNTAEFPESGKLLINRERLSYSRKLSDKFIIDERGVDGTLIEAHAPGDVVLESPDSVIIAQSAAVKFIESSSSVTQVTAFEGTLTPSVEVQRQIVSTGLTIEPSPIQLDLIIEPNVVTTTDLERSIEVASQVNLEESASVLSADREIFVGLESISEQHSLSADVEIELDIESDHIAELSGVSRQIINFLPTSTAISGESLNIISSVSAINVKIEQPKDAIISVSIISTQDVAISDEILVQTEVEGGNVSPIDTAYEVIRNVEAVSEGQLDTIRSGYDLIVGIQTISSTSISAIDTERQVTNTVNITQNAEVVGDVVKEILVQPKFEETKVENKIVSERSQVDVGVHSPAPSTFVVTQSNVEFDLSATIQRPIDLGDRIVEKQITVFASDAFEKVESIAPVVRSEPVQINIGVEPDAIRSTVSSTTSRFIINAAAPAPIETLVALPFRADGIKAHQFTSIVPIPVRLLGDQTRQNQTVISSIISPGVNEIESLSTLANSGIASNSNEVNRIVSTGAVDYFVESAVLNDFIVTRDSGNVALASPYNQVDTRDSGSILVSNNGDLEVKRTNRDFRDKYSLINVGFNKQTFENLAFIDSGSSDVELTLQNLEDSWTYLTVEDFTERGQSSYTGTGDFFNSSGVLSISNIGTVLSANVLVGDTTITVASSTANFPDSGFLLVNTEIIFYDTKGANTFENLTRGAQNTVAAPHTSGDVVMFFAKD